jgi:hypothetical protein
MSWALLWCLGHSISTALYLLDAILSAMSGK